MSASNRFHYITFGDPERPALLFLHGFMGSAADWSEIAPRLSDDFFCVAVDLPGHGRTQASCPDEYRMENCADRLADFLDALGIDTCKMAAYSMGGRLALYLAVCFPERFEKIVVESASPGLRTPQEREARVRHDRRLARQLETLPLQRFLHDWYRQPVFASLTEDGVRLQALIDKRMENNASGLGASLTWMGAGVQPPVWDRLDRITAQVLLIAGAKDRKYTRIAREIAKRCRRASVRIVDGAGHNVHFENPGEYLKQVTRFLKAEEQGELPPS